MSSILFSSPVSILMITALNRPPGMIYITVSLKSLAPWPYPVLSFEVNFYVFPFCLSPYQLLCVRKPIMSPAPEINGLMKKMPCSAQGLALSGVSPVCATWTLLLCSGCSILQANYW